jgi:hypothetical protein
MRGCILILLLCFNLHTYSQKSIYISKSGSNSNNGSKNAPFLTIQYGLNNVSTNDTIFITPGVYSENLTWRNQGTLSIIATGDSSNTIIDGMQTGSVLFISPPTNVLKDTIVLKNITLRNGKNDNGGAINLKNVNLKLFNVQISNNTASSSGGGLYLLTTTFPYAGPTTVIANSSKIYNNSSRNGGGIFSSESDIYLINSKITNNIAAAFGGGINQDGGRLEISSSSIDSNRANSGGGISYVGFLANIINSEIHANFANISGGIEFFRGGTSGFLIGKLKNLNIYNNSNGAIFFKRTQFEIDSIKVFNNTLLNKFDQTRGTLTFLNDNSDFTNSLIYKNKRGNDNLVHAAIAFEGYSGRTRFNNIIVSENDDIGIQGDFNFQNSSVIDGGSIINSQILNQRANNITKRKSTAIALDLANTKITKSNIINPEGFGITVGDGTPVISLSNLINYYGLLSSNSSFSPDAKNNYWGSQSGPYHQLDNSLGKGDTVSRFSFVKPWLTQLTDSAPTMIPLNLTLLERNSSQIKIKWNKSNLSEVQKYKIYYSKTKDGYPYQNSIDGSLDTTFTLTNISCIDKYYFAITLIDKKGKESWYSNEIFSDQSISASPIVTDSIKYCQNSLSNQLNAIKIPGCSLVWYGTSVIGGTATSTAPTPSTSIEGFTNYYVSQKDSLTSCESPRSKITVIINKLPSAPVLKDTGFCIGGVPTKISAIPLAKNVLLWYGTNITGGTSTTTAPIHNLANAGLTDYYVSQKDSLTGCESLRSKISVTVYSFPIAPIVKDTSFCYGVNSSTLSATVTSNNYSLKWYGTNSTGGVGTTLQSIASTGDTISKSYFVSQVTQSAGCEGPRSKINVKINILPVQPTVKDTLYCNNINADTLRAGSLNGHTLIWYGTSMVGGTANNLGTKPNTASVGNFNYYVSQKNNSTGCESPRSKIGVTINSLPIAPVVRDTNYCNNASSDTLRFNTSTGATLLWYGSNATGGTGTSIGIKPSTATVGTASYYLSQIITTTGCEGPRSKVVVITKPLPNAPTISRDTANYLVSGTSATTWYKDGAALTDTTQKYKPTTPGSYTAKTTSNGCASIMSAVYYYLVTDIINLSKDEFIKLAPNPFINKLNFDFVVMGYQKLNIEVFSLTSGFKVASMQNLQAGLPIYLGQLAPGTYIINVTSNDNKISHQFKMIKL